jgi:membrane protease YdiL (CAAX protease family)
LLLAMFLFLLAAQFWVPLLIPLDESLSHSHPLRLMRSSVGLVATCLFLGVLTRRWPKALPLSFYRRPIMAYAIFLPLLALVAFFNRILVEDVLGREIPFELFEGFLELQGTPLFLAAVLLVIFVPWFEEILFRNYLWGAMVKNPGFGIVRSLLFTSLAFAVLHPPTVWLPVFCLGFFLGWVRWRSGRLSEAVLLHQLHNLVVLLLFFPINS